MSRSIQSFYKHDAVLVLFFYAVIEGVVVDCGAVAVVGERYVNDAI